MTKKDFTLLAEVINLSYHRAQGFPDTPSRRAAFKLAVWLEADMVRALARTNPAFDASRFRAACRKGFDFHLLGTVGDEAGVPEEFNP